MFISRLRYPRLDMLLRHARRYAYGASARSAAQA